MKKCTEDCDFLTNGFREKIKQILPFSGEYLEIHIYSSEHDGIRENWVLESGVEKEHMADNYLCEKRTGPIPDSRKNRWYQPKDLLWKVYISDELKRKMDEKNKIPLEGFMELVLEQIAPRFKNCLMFEELLRKDEETLGYLLKKMDDVNWLLNKYADNILAEKKMPKNKVITQLSAQMYEKRPIHGRICFVSEDIWKKIYAESKGKILDLQAVKPEQRELKMENMRGIRKFLEMTGKDTCLVAAVGKIPMIRAVFKVKDVEGKGGMWLEFDGHLKWKIQSDDVFWVGYKNGIPYLQIEDNFQEEYKQKIEEIKLEDKEKILEIVELLKKEEHGTSIVFMEKEKADNEIERFYQNNRCIRLEEQGIELIDYLKEIPDITAIDGALLADLSGKCYAIGVIFDGEVKKPGKVERGARYNSVANYVYIKKCEEPDSQIFGVIVSEDKSVEVEIPELIASENKD